MEVDCTLLTFRTVAPIANAHIFCASRVHPAGFVYNVQWGGNKICNISPEVLFM